MSVSSRPAWSSEGVSGQPGVHRETLYRKTNKQKEFFMLLSLCLLSVLTKGFALYLLNSTENTAWERSEGLILYRNL